MLKQIFHLIGRISIRARIAAGFGLLLALLIGISVNYDLSLRNVRQRVAEIDSAAAVSDALIQFSRDFLEARRLVEVYLRAPNALELVEARNAQKAVSGEADDLTALIGDESADIKTKIVAFQKAFDQMVQDMEAREKSLAALTAGSARLTNFGVTLASGLAAQGDPAAGAAVRFNQAVQELAKAALRFSIEPNPGDADIVHLEKSRLTNEIAALKNAPPNNSQLAQLLNSLSTPAYLATAAGNGLVLQRADFDSDLDKMTAIGVDIGKASDDLRSRRLDIRNQSIAAAGTTIGKVLTAGIVTSGLAIGVGLMLAALVGYSISRLMRRTTNVMSALAKGDLTTEIYGAGRGDEIGMMARAIQVFKEAAIEKLGLESQAATARRQAESERLAREAEKAEEAERDQFAIDTLGGALGHLAEGDLAFRIAQPFAEKTEKLRNDFNASLDTLNKTMVTVNANSQTIRMSTEAIASAALDLSQRTEQQAANLERTAATLDEITVTVKRAAEEAGHASEVVAATKSGAEQSGAVVREAIEAMSRIEKSSQQIGQIIGVVDQLAFQTNLLALNAGVEAARAGDAGRGFAVVASEVRALAQRSTEAAKEIKALISTSSQQVAQGVDRVNATGEALTLIVTQVAEIDAAVTNLASGAREQASALQQVNVAISQMDRATQENAARVEETTAAANDLSSETERLQRLIETFRVTGEGPKAALFSDEDEEFDRSAA